ncbi:MAG: 3-hydroxyacyl-CoA dehydrogenase NAD-binding domain-containing protein [Pseudomonadota bacterium]
MSVDTTHADLDLKDWTFHIDFEDIAWAVFDRENESVNSLGRRPMEELGKIVLEIENKSSKGLVKGLVIMSGKSNFIAGADIREFDTYTTQADVKTALAEGIELFDRIEALRVPVVAAIHGYCLGGGLELALACHYCIADKEDGTRIAFPEVKLGIFPGLNGTLRSLKKAGPIGAMDVMLTGRMVRPGAARAMGLIDKLVDTHHQLRWAARKAILKKHKSPKLAWWKRAMNFGPVRKYLAEQMRKKTASKVRQDHYPAPFELIDIFEKYGNDYDRLKRAETESFAPLMVGDTAKNLRRVFHLSEMLKNQAPKGGKDLQRAHVIGAGTMGGDIAAWCVFSGMEVSLQDMSADAIENAKKRAKKLFQKRLKSKVAVEAAMARMIADVGGGNVPRADIIIEAIVEKLDIKQELFAELEVKAKPDAILATNTSSLPIENIARRLKNPERLIGIHFFNPVAKMPLVEVIKAPSSDADVIERACAFVTQIKKFPVVVKSNPGFLVNRVLSPYMFTAIARYEAGIMREKIDEAALRFGMPMGPLELCDIVGLDICRNVSDTLGYGATDDSEFGQLVKNGKLGKKTGEGFYVWEDGKPKKEEMNFSDEELDKLAQELIKPMLAESEKCLKEGIVETADMVDAGVIFGTGFAPFRGGPLHYLENLNETNTSSAQAAE